MKRRACRWLLLLLVCWFVPGIAAARDFKILILHSYHSENPGTRQQHAAFVATLTRELPQHRFDFFAEYLDGKRKAFTPKYEAFFLAYLQEKFRGFRPDAIYATDDNALTFLQRHKDRLFPGVPVVFSGINNLQLEERLDHEQYMGVFERQDVLANVALARKFDPQVQTVYVVGDGCSTHDLIRQFAERQRADQAPELQIEYLADRDLSVLRRMVAEKAQGTLVVTTLGGLLRETGDTVPISQAVGALAGAGNFKILVMRSNYLVDGVLGGNLSEVQSQGREAAHVFIGRLIEGLSYHQFPDRGRDLSRYAFRYAELQRFHIPLALLPEDSRILDAPDDLANRQGGYLVAVALLALLQAAVIIVLLPKIRSLRIVQQALKRSERRFNTVVEAINDAVVAVNEQGRIMTFNAAAERMFGYDRQSMFDQPLDVLLPVAYRDKHRHYLERFFRCGPARDMLGRSVEVLARHSGGQEFHVELTLSLWQHKNSQAVVAAMRDITERKRAEEALRQSEERYRTLAQHQGEAVIRWLPDTTLTYANEVYARLRGKTPEELLGKKFIDQVPPGRRGLMEEHIRALLAHPGTRAFEGPVRLADGQMRWYRWNNTAVVGELGEVVEIQSLGLDITERKQIEEDLRESEARFRDLAGLLPQTVFEVDTMGRLTFANRVGMELFGLRESHLARGMSVFEVVAAPDRVRAEQDFLHVLSGETLSSEEYLLETHNGFRFRGMVSVSPIFRKAQILGVRGTIVDISDRVAVEEALRQSERKFKRLYREFQALLDGIPDSIALIGPDRSVLRTNLETARLLGQPVQDLPGQECCALWKNCSCRGDDCPVTRSFASGQPHQAIVKSEGERTWEVRTFPICNKAGQTVQVIRYAIDITQQVQLREEALRAGQLASLGELAAGVAHEINNPINGIINYAQLLVDDFNGSHEDRDILCGIIEEGDRIANIVRNLLSFARSRKEQKGPVGVWDILSCSLALTESQLRKDGIYVQIEVARDLPPIMAHAQQIQQVVLNLISNARYALNQKYAGSHPDKVFRIASELCRQGNRAAVRLIFHDHGCGIPRDIQYKVMDPFFTTKPSGQGTGLGLSISHGIIEDHGGRLSIETEEGQFTMVAIDLPVAEEEEA